MGFIIFCLLFGIFVGFGGGIIGGNSDAYTDGEICTHWIAQLYEKNKIVEGLTFLGCPPILFFVLLILFALLIPFVILIPGCAECVFSFFRQNKEIMGLGLLEYIGSMGASYFFGAWWNNLMLKKGYKK